MATPVGHRSAKEITKEYTLTGDTILTTTESRQLAILAGMDEVDYIIQEEVWVQEGIVDAKMYKPGIMNALQSVEMGRKIFFGDSPSILVVGHSDKMTEMNSVVQQLIKFVPTLGNLFMVVLFGEGASDMDSAKFLSRALSLQQSLQQRPAKMYQADRLLTSVKRATHYQAWVAVSTHVSRSSQATVQYKLLRMMDPGHDPVSYLFESEEAPAMMMAIQYHKTWESALLGELQLQRPEAVIVPGVDPAHTKLLFKELTLEECKSVVERLGRQPRFAIMPIPWYRGDAVDDKPVRLEAWIRREHSMKHGPFLFAYVLAILWDMGEIPGVSKSVSVQVLHYNKVRIGIAADIYPTFKEKYAVLNESVGLNCKSEDTGEFLSNNEGEGESTTPSMCPAEWGSVESAYLINVPPWWNATALTTMLSVTEAGKQALAVRMKWSVGEIRTTTWKISGPQVCSMIGSVFRSSDKFACITVISSHEYASRKAKPGGKGGKAGKGGSQDTRPAAPAPAEMELDTQMMKIFKRKRADTPSSHD